MKTVITTAAALLFCAVAGRGAAAQTGIPLSPSVYVGGALPVGQATKSQNPGFTAGAGLDMGAARSVFLRAEASYAYFPAPADPTEDPPITSDASARINVVLAKHTSILAFTPYAVGGIGAYHVHYAAPAVYYTSVSSTAASDDWSSDGHPGNKFGWNGGVGVEIPGGAIASRLELRYHRISTAPGGDAAYLTFTFGMRLVRL